MASLSALKKKRGGADNLKKLQEKVEQSSNRQPRDERIWKPKFNKDKGKGSCIVRFLTPKEGDPFVERLSHSFGGPGGNYYDLAREMIGEDDPVQIAAINGFRKAKADGDASLKQKCLKFLPQRRYFANIYVVKDVEQPDTEGKVFVFEFGPAIYKKIIEVIKPEFDEDEPLDPFDYWSGADFVIKMIGTEIPDSRDKSKKVLVPNYDKSEFSDPSEFMDGDDDRIDEVFQQTHNLTEFVDASKVKSFDDVAKRFKDVMGHSYKWLSPDDDEDLSNQIKEAQTQQKMDDEKDEDDGSDDHRDEPEPEEQESGSDSVDEDDDPLARWKKLANNQD